jgi:hypothetical protein
MLRGGRVVIIIVATQFALIVTIVKSAVVVHTCVVTPISTSTPIEAASSSERATPSGWVTMTSVRTGTGGGVTPTAGRMFETC